MESRQEIVDQMMQDFKVLDKVIAYWIVGSVLYIFLSINFLSSKEELIYGSYFLHYLVGISPVGGALGFIFAFILTWVADYFIGRLTNNDQFYYCTMTTYWLTRFVSENIILKLIGYFKEQNHIDEPDSKSTNEEERIEPPDNQSNR